MDFFDLLGTFVLVSLRCYNKLSKIRLLINNILGGWEESEMEVLAGQDLVKASGFMDHSVLDVFSYGGRKKEHSSPTKGLIS